MNWFSKQKEVTDIENKITVIKRERVDRGINQEVGTNMYTLLYIK